MTCLVLAAGYATRLYPLTENFPKPLLEVKGRTILDWLLDDIESANLVEKFVVVSNHKFYKHFEEWAKTKKYEINIVDDNTSTNETRLGAVIDIQFGIDKLNIDDDLLVIAGDNLLDFSLTNFINYAKLKNTSCVMRYFEKDQNKLKKCGVISIVGDRITNMVEKPPVPESNWCVPPFYYYKKSDVKLVNKAIDNGCNTDAPGSFIAWLCKETTVNAMKMPGKRFDIGNLESYNKVNNDFKGF